jgi:hypothetical protein
LGVELLLHPGEYFCLPLIEEQVDLTVWTDEHTWDGHEQLLQPKFISRTLPGFPIKNNILQSQKLRRGLIPIIKD